MKLWMVGIACVGLAASVAGAEIGALWYERPGEQWLEALPVGNGRLGAMVFGRTHEERIQFNVDTLWTGGPKDYVNSEAKGRLAEVRRLIFEDQVREAEAIAQRHLMGRPLRVARYQPFADLRITYGEGGEISGYRRELDLETGIARSAWGEGAASITQEVYASAIDDVLVVDIQAAAQLPSLSIRFACPHAESTTRRIDGRTLALSGRLGDRLDPKLGEVVASVLGFEARVSVRSDGTSVRVDDESIQITGARRVTLVLAADSSYRTYRDVSADPASRCAAALQQAAGHDEPELRARHLADHRPKMRRVELDLGGGEARKRPTDARIRAFEGGSDPALAALYFQFGRYLLLASSRSSQPANLQGLWCEDLDPSWGSGYTTNINLPMNYWIADAANLPETAEPLFRLLEEAAATGAKIAAEHYGARGWVMHHNTDIWRATAPANRSDHGLWPTGGAWLCRHLFERYRYSGDEAFLARAYPVMKGAAAFFLDFLVEDPRSGELVSVPSSSPEQGRIGLLAAPAMDHQIIRQLFADCIEAAGVLGIDASFAAELDATRRRIAPDRIGRFGQLQEWTADIDKERDKHRHLSHLYALFPGEEITPGKTPQLAAAARVSLEGRGEDGPGWALAWKAACRARLGEGDRAHSLLAELIAKRSAPNLFDVYPPFQIDANLGGPAAMIEMLLQSHDGAIALLPALPPAWPTGRVSGLKARGGVAIDMTWRDGRLNTATLRPTRQTTLRIQPPPGHRIASIRDQQAAHQPPPGPVSLQLHPDRTYELRFAAD